MDLNVARGHGIQGLEDDVNELKLDKTWSHNVERLTQVKKHNFSQILKSDSILDKMKLHKLSDNEELSNILKDSFDSVSPLIYLNSFQRDILLNRMNFVHYTHKSKIYSPDDKPGPGYAFVLLKGEVHIYNSENAFEDFCPTVTVFGYEGPIFQQRTKIALAEQDSFIGLIKPEDYLEFIVLY